MQMLGLAGASGGENAMDDSMQKTEAQGRGFDLSSILMGQSSPTGGKAWASPNQAAADPTASRLDVKQLLGWLK